MRLTLLPCYDGQPYDGDLSPFHPLNGRLDEEELRAFLLELSNFGSDRFPRRTLPEVVDHLMSKETVVIGGGLVAVKDAYRLFPGCCSGLESWRAWDGTRQGAGPGFMGHDPNAWVDVSGPQAILHNGSGRADEALAVSYEEIAVAVEQAGADLEAFIEIMRTWLHQSGILNADDFVSKLAEWFWIGPDANLRAEQVKRDFADLLARLHAPRNAGDI